MVFSLTSLPLPTKETTLINDSFNAETGIVMAVVSGKVTIEEILDWTDTLTPERFPTRSFRGLFDASDVEYSFRPAQLKKFVEAITDFCTYFETVKIATVHTNARGLAFSEVIRSNISNKNFSQQSFFIREAALKWLLNGGIESLT